MLQLLNYMSLSEDKEGGRKGEKEEKEGVQAVPDRTASEQPSKNPLVISDGYSGFCLTHSKGTSVSSRHVLSANNQGPLGS